MFLFSQIVCLSYKPYIIFRVFMEIFFTNILVFNDDYFLMNFNLSVRISSLTSAK
jgi:hypothetical protein